jgi:predicted NBD/HSP70 family sugar kinase
MSKTPGNSKYVKKINRMFIQGLAVANVVNFYNPQTVFLGGKLASGWVLSFPELAQDTKIIPGAFGAYFRCHRFLRPSLAAVALSAGKTM